MIDCNILANGDLQLTLDDTESGEFADSLERHGFWTAFCDGMESYSCNGSFTLFDAGDGNPFVGLTSAPCIAESMDYADNGTQSIDGRFWYFDNYQIECPLETLRDAGAVIFTLAR